MQLKNDLLLTFDVNCGIMCEKNKKGGRNNRLLSEWRDSNARPLAPHARMLANCTTPRFLNWTAKVILFVSMAMIFLKNF